MRASIHLWYTGTSSSVQQWLFWGISLLFLDVNSDGAEQVDRSEGYSQARWNTVDGDVDERSIEGECTGEAQTENQQDETNEELASLSYDGLEWAAWCRVPDLIQ